MNKAFKTLEALRNTEATLDVARGYLEREFRRTRNSQIKNVLTVLSLKCDELLGWTKDAMERIK